MWYAMTIMYILSLCFSPNYESVLAPPGLNYYVFLGPNLKLLEAWGCKDQQKMLINHQFWRLFTAMFLSVGFQQYVFNSIALILIGFMLEATKPGFVPMLIITLGSGISGTFFGSVCDFKLAVGVDIAYFGYTGALLAAVIVNWKALEPIGMMRLCFVMMTVFLFMILLLFTAPSALHSTGVLTSTYWTYYDFYGHFGSFLTGLFLGLIVIRRCRQVGRLQEKSYEKMCFYAGIAGCLVYLIVMLPIWFTVP